MWKDCDVRKMVVNERVLIQTLCHCQMCWRDSYMLYPKRLFMWVQGAGPWSLCGEESEPHPCPTLFTKAPFLSSKSNTPPFYVYPLIISLIASILCSLWYNDIMVYCMYEWLLEQLWNGHVLHVCYGFSITNESQPNFVVQNVKFIFQN